MLVDFHAEWCGPCKVQSPILAEIAREMEGRLKVIKIDVDRNPGIAGRYQVRSVPTLALFRQGGLLWRQSGVMDKGRLKSTLSSYL